MTDVFPDQITPGTLVEATDITEHDIARKNIIWGWALLGLFLVLFGGTIGVALVYLWLD
jgi:hypothetical protein